MSYYDKVRARYFELLEAQTNLSAALQNGDYLEEAISASRLLEKSKVVLENLCPQPISMKQLELAENYLKKALRLLIRVNQKLV